MATKFHVPDMSCGHCKVAIQDAIDAADPLASVAFDMEARTINVNTELDQVAITALLDKAGFPASVD